MKTKPEPERYFIRLEGAYREVKGKPVSLPGHEDKDLFVNRNVNGCSGWTVSDGRTGMAVCFGKTEHQAVQNLRELMEKPRGAALGRMIEEALRAGCRSPREEARSKGGG